MHSIKVLLADGEPLFRRGLAKFLSTMELVGEVEEAGTGLETVDQARTLNPDLIILDLKIIDYDGLTTIQKLKSEGIKSTIVVLSFVEDEETVMQAIKNGADGYLLKSIQPDELLEMVRAFVCGALIFSPKVANKIMDKLRCLLHRQPEVFCHQAVLSRRQRQVLKFMEQGLSNKEIGVKLNISPNTVKNHIQSILKKLEVDNRIQAVSYAINQGLSLQETD